MIAPRGKLICSLVLGSLFIFSTIFRLHNALNYRRGEFFELWTIVMVLLLTLAWYQVFRAERGARSRSDEK